MSHIEIRTPASIMRAEAREALALAQQAERNAFLYMLVACAALGIALALVAWSIWA